MEPIKAWQIKRIHFLLNRCGIADEDYRARMSEDYGVRTCKKLASDQAKTLIQDIEAFAKEWNIDISLRPDYVHRPGMATPAQLRKIEAMWANVSRAKTAKARRKALRTFLTKRFGVSDPRFIPHEMPSKIIHTLAAMKKQKQAARTA